MKKIMCYGLMVVLLLVLTGCETEKIPFESIHDSFIEELINLGYQCDETVCVLDVYEEDTNNGVTFEETYEYKYYIETKLFTYYELISISTDSEAVSWNDNYVQYEIYLISGYSSGSYLQEFYYNPDETMTPEYTREATFTGSLYEDDFQCEDNELDCMIGEDALEDLTEYINEILNAFDSDLDDIEIGEISAMNEELWEKINEVEFYNTEVWAGHGIYFHEANGVKYCVYMDYGSGIPITFLYPAEITFNEKGNIVVTFPVFVVNHDYSKDTDRETFETVELIYVDGNIVFNEWIFVESEFSHLEMSGIIIEEE